MSIQYQISTQPLAEQNTDCLIIPILGAKVSSQIMQLLDSLSQGQTTRFVTDNMQNKQGEIAMLFEPIGILSKRIIFVYCQEESSQMISNLQSVMQKVAGMIKGKDIHSLGCYVEDFPDTLGSVSDKISIIIQAFEASCYQFSMVKHLKKASDALRKFYFCLHDSAQNKKVFFAHAIQKGCAIAAGMTLTKDLVNMPSNVCTPTYMAQVAQSVAYEYSTVQVQILDSSNEIVQQMGAFRAVAQGSEEPAKFVALHYKPSIEDTRSPIALIGKGVTFDSGGLSLKPSRNMDEMKSDMAGAASVLGAMKAIAEMKCSVPIVGILPLTKNLPSGSACKPGDIITTLSGKTVEILDTDAEGRLILADAITYSLQFDPAVVIDIATLTGAVIVALGNIASGLMSTHDQLSKAIIDAGAASGDRVWRLPCWPEYQALIKSEVADIANLGKGGAGSITAACFLKEFTENKPWAHLDIAGTAFDKKWTTGRGVPLLVQYIMDYCTQQL